MCVIANLSFASTDLKLDEMAKLANLQFVRTPHQAKLCYLTLSLANTDMKLDEMALEIFVMVAWLYDVKKLKIYTHSPKKVLCVEAFLRKSLGIFFTPEKLRRVLSLGSKFHRNSF